jgi:hypothetical protein
MDIQLDMSEILSSGLTSGQHDSEMEQNGPSGESALQGISEPSKDNNSWFDYSSSPDDALRLQPFLY